MSYSSNRSWPEWSDLSLWWRGMQLLSSNPTLVQSRLASSFMKEICCACPIALTTGMTQYQIEHTKFHLYKQKTKKPRTRNNRWCQLLQHIEHIQSSLTISAEASDFACESIHGDDFLLTLRSLPWISRLLDVCPPSLCHNPCVQDWAKTTYPNFMKLSRHESWDRLNWLHFGHRTQFSRSSLFRKSQDLTIVCFCDHRRKLFMGSFDWFEDRKYGRCIGHFSLNASKAEMTVKWGYWYFLCPLWTLG